MNIFTVTELFMILFSGLVAWAIFTVLFNRLEQKMAKEADSAKFDES